MGLCYTLGRLEFFQIFCTGGITVYQGMLAETVNLQGHNGDVIETYLARPLGAGPYPGVVVIHHMPGWDEESKETTRKLAYHGYVAICPSAAAGWL